MNNNWKDYQVKPDEGLFDAVHRRLRVRRILRIAAVAFVAVSVALVVVLSTGKDTTSSSVNEQSSVRKDRIASQVTPQHAIHNAEASPAVEPEDAPQAEPAVKAVGKLVAEESMPLLQPQAAVPVVVEPVTDAIPAENTVRQPAATPVNPMQDTPVITAEPDTPYVVQETQAVANASSAKVGGADPVPYQVDNILWAPNIITPNGDVAENRVFKVVASSTVSDFRIHIYNRGGRLLFKSSDINEVWDATHDGTTVPQGAYVWVATFRGTDGSSHRQAGTVTVVW